MKEDVELLTKAIANESLSEKTREVFEDMLLRLEEGRQTSLSEKQRKWVRSTLGEEEYANLISNGLAPRGREAPTPKVLLNRPLRPPGR